jgi:hypothetical protein
MCSSTPLCSAQSDLRGEERVVQPAPRPTCLLSGRKQSGSRQVRLLRRKATGRMNIDCLMVRHIHSVGAVGEHRQDFHVGLVENPLAVRRPTRRLIHRVAMGQAFGAGAIRAPTGPIFSRERGRSRSGAVERGADRPQSSPPLFFGPARRAKGGRNSVVFSVVTGPAHESPSVVTRIAPLCIWLSQPFLRGQRHRM